MKKIGFVSLALLGAFALTGCSCSKVTGTYKKYAVTMGEKEYICETTDNDVAKYECEFVMNDEITLGADGKMTIKAGNTTKEYFYKVEDGKVYRRVSENDDWETYGTLDGKKLTYLNTVYKR